MNIPSTAYNKSHIGLSLISINKKNGFVKKYTYITNRRHVGFEKVLHFIITKPRIYGLSMVL